MDLQSAIVSWLRKNNPKTQEQVDQDASMARAGADRIASKLPEPLIPHEGLKEKKRRMTTMDPNTSTD